MGYHTSPAWTPWPALFLALMCTYMPSHQTLPPRLNALNKGNICRSPTAEAMFRSVVEKAGLAGAFDIDSCGTGGGNPDWYDG
jgi:hypothetical protein